MNRLMNAALSKNGSRAIAVYVMVMASMAHAQSIGKGLVTWGTPIVAFLGVAAVITALVGAMFKPELVKSAVFVAFIMVIVFFLLRNMSSFQSAVTQ